MKNILPSLRRNLILQVLILASLLPGLSLFTIPVQANPSGHTLVHGNVAFSGLGTSQLNIVQGSQNAIINWESFSIQSGEVTNFIQPNQNAMALNRVTGVDPSAIYGSLNANGGVIVINPNGIVVHSGGRVDVAGMLTMSTLNTTNEDFLNGGPMRFKGTGAGTGEYAGQLRNYGAISSASGDVVLLGNFLQNSGQVSAATGTVAFGAGGDIIVNQTASGGKISVLAGGVGGDNGIENTAAGEINGAAAELKAHGNVYALAIKNDGVVRANGYNFSGGKLTLSGGSGGSVINTGNLYARNANGSGGRVEISGGNVSLAAGTVDASGAAGMAGGTVSVTGDSVNVGNGATVDVSGATAGSVSLTGVTEANVAGSLSAAGSVGAGGSVDVTAETVTIGSSAIVDVSGAAQGGSARIGGGFQGGEADIDNARSVEVEEGSLFLADSAEGDAGRIVVWADGDTTFRGEVSARAFGAVGNGGFVEVSGKETLYFNGLVSTLSAHGANGTLLLDPTDVVIGAVGGTTTLVDTALLAALASGNVVIHTASSRTESGNIIVSNGANLVTGYNTVNSLAFFAHGDIIINDDIQNAGAGNITLFAGWDGTGASNFGFDPTSPDATAVAPAVSFANVVNDVTYGVWGQNGGDVIINGDGAGAVSVGSARGETNAFGNQVIIAGGNGNNRFGQLGYRTASDNPTGAINIRAKDDVIISSIFGDLSGGGRIASYVMVGHGGSNQTSQPTKSGDGNLSGDISVVSEDGGIIMHGGRNRSFSHIGHGGQELIGDKDGNIMVRGNFLDMRGALFLSGSAATSDRAGIRIGHGGYESHGGGFGFSGNIDVEIEGTILGVSGNLNSGSNGANHIDIGHGGYQSGVVAQGAVTRDLDSYSHGGTGAVVTAPGAVSRAMEGHTGDIRLISNTGSIDFTLAQSASTQLMIGHGGRHSHGNHDGDIVVQAAGSVLLKRNMPDVISGVPYNFLASDNASIQIGHGGNRAGGAFTGEISLISGGNFEMTGGANTAYGQIGHGGYADGRSGSNAATFIQNARNGHATLSGNIFIDVAGDFGMYSGMAEGSAYTMVGHGGVNRTAFGIVGDGAGGQVLIDREQRGHHGNITMNVGGNLEMIGEAKDTSDFGNVAGSSNFTQIGHGGIRSSGDHYGAISVTIGGDLEARAGQAGYEVYRSNIGTPDWSGAQTGADNYAMIGHGGVVSHLYSGTDTSNSVFIQDNGNHNGEGFGAITNTTMGINNSDITLTIGGDFDLVSGQTAGTPRSDQVKIDPMTDPDIAVRGMRNYTMVGHGGYGDGNALRDPSDGAVETGEITVVVGGALTMRAGGVQQKGPNPIPAAGGYEIVLANFSHIGHGGQAFESSFAGDIIVRTGSDITITAGNSYQDIAKIGHGGFDSGRFADVLNDSTLITGSLLVESGGSISLTGGGGTNTFSGANTRYSFAKIGHGAYNRGQTIDEDITVRAANDINLSGGATYRDGFSQIGHGGLTNADGLFSGTIDVTAGDNINLTSTTGQTVGLNTTAVRNYAKIGHGDTDSVGATKSQGTWNGDIFVKAGNDLTSVNGMIGHADPTNGDGFTRSMTGHTYIAVGRDDPTGAGGNLTLDADTVITSSRFGGGGNLRFYIPGVGGVDNFIADGANFNGAIYTRTPFPDGTRDDEQLATEFTFSFNSLGLPTGSFLNPPEGTYPPNSFGRYNIYYADQTVVVDAGDGGGGAIAPPVVSVPFSFVPFFFRADTFDAFGRGSELLGYDGYAGQLFSFSAADVQEDDSDFSTGDGFFEEMLDANLGILRVARVSEDNTVLADEGDEELALRQQVAERRPGRVGGRFYIFDPSSNRYSSYRVVGVPQSSLTVAR